MPSSQALLASAGVIAVVIAMMADGRNAVSMAAVVLAAGLAPTAAAAGGGPAVLVITLAAAACVVVGLMARLAARRLAWIAGIDPTIPAFAPARQLFGPRSARAVAIALALPAASWVSSQVVVGEVAAVQGLLFAAAYAWCCGGLRLVLARTVADLAVGVVMISMASSTGWLIRAGPDALVGAAAIAALTPATALVSGWLGGRHARRSDAVPSVPA